MAIREASAALTPSVVRLDAAPAPSDSRIRPWLGDVIGLDRSEQESAGLHILIVAHMDLLDLAGHPAATGTTKACTRAWEL